MNTVTVRSAVAEDALCLSVLAMQVFLDTYATQGIRPAIAREVQSAYSQDVFARALGSPAARVMCAERAGHLVGFAQVSLGAVHALAPAGVQAELLRLYVQEPFTGQGVGSLRATLPAPAPAWLDAASALRALRRRRGVAQPLG